MRFTFFARAAFVEVSVDAESPEEAVQKARGARVYDGCPSCDCARTEGGEWVALPLHRELPPQEVTVESDDGEMSAEAERIWKGGE